MPDVELLIMARTGRVSMHWQTVFMVCLPTWIYAFYRIEKLRLALAINIPSFLGLGLLSEFLLFPDEFFSDDISDEYQMFQLMLTALEIAFSVFLVRRWTRKWNDKFSNEPNNQDDDENGLFHTR